MGGSRPDPQGVGARERTTGAAVFLVRGLGAVLLVSVARCAPPKDATQGRPASRSRQGAGAQSGGLAPGDPTREASRCWVKLRILRSQVQEDPPRSATRSHWAARTEPAITRDGP